MCSCSLEHLYHILGFARYTMSQVLSWHETGITQIFYGNITRRLNGQPGYGGMININSQPSLRWKLQSTANKIADNISVTHNQSVCVVFFRCRGTMEITSEASFNASTITEELLQLQTKQEKNRKEKTLIISKGKVIIDKDSAKRQSLPCIKHIPLILLKFAIDVTTFLDIPKCY